MVISRKKDETVWICLDYTKLNSITITDAESVPGADDPIMFLSTSRIFCKLEMTKRYYQIPMSQLSKRLTTFYTPLWLYKFNYMRFDLVNALVAIVRMTKEVQRCIKNLVTYMDVMCIHTEHASDHIEIMFQLFATIHENQLTINFSR